MAVILPGLILPKINATRLRLSPGGEFWINKSRASMAMRLPEPIFSKQFPTSQQISCYGKLTAFKYMYVTSSSGHSLGGLPFVESTFSLDMR